MCDWFGGTYVKTSLKPSALIRRAGDKLKLTAGRPDYKKVQINNYADMAELADAHGSGPCESDFMQVQVLLSALN